MKHGCMADRTDRGTARLVFEPADHLLVLGVPEDVGFALDIGNRFSEAPLEGFPVVPVDGDRSDGRFAALDDAAEFHPERPRAWHLDPGAAVGVLVDGALDAFPIAFDAVQIGKNLDQGICFVTGVVAHGGEEDTGELGGRQVTRAASIGQGIRGFR